MNQHRALDNKPILAKPSSFCARRFAQMWVGAVDNNDPQCREIIRQMEAARVRNEQTYHD